MAKKSETRYIRVRQGRVVGVIKDEDGEDVPEWEYDYGIHSVPGNWQAPKNLADGEQYEEITEAEARKEAPELFGDGSATDAVVPDELSVAQLEKLLAAKKGHTNPKAPAAKPAAKSAAKGAAAKKPAPASTKAPAEPAAGDEADADEQTPPEE